MFCCFKLCRVDAVLTIVNTFSALALTSMNLLLTSFSIYIVLSIIHFLFFWCCSITGFGLIMLKEFRVGLFVHHLGNVLTLFFGFILAGFIECVSCLAWSLRWQLLGLISTRICFWRPSNVLLGISLPWLFFHPNSGAHCSWYVAVKFAVIFIHFFLDLAIFILFIFIKFGCASLLLFGLFNVMSF